MTHRDRIEAYFAACSSGSAEDIAPDAIYYDTNHNPARGAEAIGKSWSNV